MPESDPEKRRSVSSSLPQAQRERNLVRPSASVRPSVVRGSAPQMTDADVVIWFVGSTAASALTAIPGYIRCCLSRRT